MKNIIFTITFCLIYLGQFVVAQNPIIQTYYTADPAPMVYNDKVYLYTTHDEDETIDNFFTMHNWRTYSSSDMVNWTDHGVVASLKNFKWMDRTTGAWASQCIERNGKFYLYCPVHGEGVLVLVADSPTGPFEDVLGRRLITDTPDVWYDIDPTVFIDDDGQAYLFWGNPQIYYVKLNEDMISYDRSVGENGVVKIDMTYEAFGKHQGTEKREYTNYTEGPWVYKRGDIYYLVYAAAGIPEMLGYSTAKSFEGPWEYQGLIMERAPHLAFTNHPGIIDFKGNSYLFYHTQGLSGEGFKRSVSIEQFEYNNDGSIPTILPTEEGVINAVANLNPFSRVEAETIAWSEGVKTAQDDKVGVYVTKIDNDDFIKVRNVDFRNGAKKFIANVASAKGGAIIEIRLDGIDGKLIGKCKVGNTGGELNWKEVSTKIKKVEGVHDLYLVFKGKEEELFNFDWWTFK